MTEPRNVDAEPDASAAAGGADTSAAPGGADRPATGRPGGPTPGSWIAPDGRSVAHAASPPASDRKRRDGRDGRHGRDGRGSGAFVGGAILIVIGGYFLVRQLVPGIDLSASWPVVSVALGVVLVVLALLPRGRTGAPRP